MTLCAWLLWMLYSIDALLAGLVAILLFAKWMRL